MPTFYAIRHKPSGKFLPQLRRRRGHTFAEPMAASEAVPRLFLRESTAKTALTYWLQGVWTQQFSPPGYDDPGGEYEGNAPLEPRQERKREEMEIVPVAVTL